MGETLVGAAGVGTGASTTTASQTLYGPIANSICSFAFSTEAEAQAPVGAAGTFSGLSVYALTNSRSSSATVLTFRKNAANGNQTVSCTASTTGYFTDAIHTDIISSGDKYCASQVTGSGLGTFQADKAFLSFLSSGTAGAPLASYITGTGLSNTNSTTVFLVSVGTLNAQTTESVNQCKVKAMTTSGLFTYLTVNGYNGATVIKSRKNSVDGNQTFSIPSATTGFFQDTTHSDSYSDGDLYDTKYDSTASNTSTARTRMVGVWAAVTTVQNVLPGSRGSIAGASSPFFLPIVGNRVDTATESNAACRMPFAGNWNNIQINIGGSGSLGSTLRSRVNGANGNQSVTFSTSGYFTDSTHTDAFIVGDLLNMSVTANGGTNATYQDTDSTISPSSAAVSGGWICLPAFI